MEDPGSMIWIPSNNNGPALDPRHPRASGVTATWRPIVATVSAVRVLKSSLLLPLSRWTAVSLPLPLLPIGPLIEREDAKGLWLVRTRDHHNGWTLS